MQNPYMCEKKLLEALSSEQKRASLTQALADTQEGPKTNLMQMCPPVLRALCNNVEEILGSMLRGSGPEASKNNGFVMFVSFLF